MSALPKRYFTPEEYLLLEERSPYKSQYVAGEIFPMGEEVTGDISSMGGAAPTHVKIATRIASLLDAQFEGRPCEVFCADLRVAVDPGEIYTYPDVVALCGEPRYETVRQPASLLNPQFVCEVLSPSTEAFDRGEKFSYYRRLGSLTDYVLVSAERMMVEHYTRRENGAWQLHVLDQPEHCLRLASLRCELALARIYSRVSFPTPRPDLGAWE